jgi:hypothetical protein
MFSTKDLFAQALQITQNTLSRFLKPSHAELLAGAF